MKLLNLNPVFLACLASYGNVKSNTGWFSGGSMGAVAATRMGGVFQGEQQSAACDLHF